ncbi:MAG: FadR family transcriptional regulator [Caldilinea sp. CFX5]|nr:FadR family transcriptional regulator [Caldilinea sp. CFX5]
MSGSLTFTPIPRVNIKEQALEQLKQYIGSGSVQVGERLPSERELAERLGIARTSVREALKILESVGLVESRVGDGTYITAQIGATIGRTIGLGLMSWGGTIMEIMQARTMIEAEAARVAADQATDEDLQALSALLTQMEKAATFHDYLTADMNFHRRIGQATQNTIVAYIINNLIDLLEEAMRQSHGVDLPAMSEGNATHREIYLALKDRAPATANDAMRRHLEFSVELWQAVIALGAATQP